MAFGTCFFKGSISDGVTQTKLEDRSHSTNAKNTLDIKRNLRFSTWSGAYCGAVQHFVYNVLYLRLFPGIHLSSKLAATTVDTLIHGPLVYLPTYYVCKSLLTGGSATDGLTEYSGNLWDIVTAYWKVWCPTVLITMTVMPMEFRILFISGVSLFWLMLLSYKAPMIEHDRDTIDASESIQTTTGMDVVALDNTSRAQPNYNIQNTPDYTQNVQ